MVYDKNHCMEVSGYDCTCAYIEEYVSRTSFRRDANKADNRAASAAVDSLINFEAVKVRLSLSFLEAGHVNSNTALQQ